MHLIFCSFYLLLSKLEYGPLSNKFFFMLYHFIQRKHLIRLNNVRLKFDIKYLKCKVFWWFFYLSVDFIQLLILNVLLFILFHFYFRVYWPNATNKTKILLFHQKGFHYLLSRLVSIQQWLTTSSCYAELWWCRFIC